MEVLFKGKFMKSMYQIFLVLVSSVFITGCATIINSEKQTVQIYTPDSTKVLFGKGSMPAIVERKPIKGEVSINVEYNEQYSLVVKDDSITAKTMMSPVLEPKWIGYNTYTYQIGTIVDVASGKMYQHRNVKVLHFPQDSSLIEGYSSRYFQKQLATCKTYEQGNALVEDNRNEVPFMAKWLMSLLSGLAIPFIIYLTSRKNADLSIFYSMLLFAPVYMGALSSWTVTGLGGINNEGGSFGPTIGSYYGGYYLGLISSVLVYVLNPSIFESSSYSQSTTFEKINVFAIITLPFIMASLLAVIGYNNSRPRHILARPNSLSLSENVSEPYKRSLSFDIPSIGIKVLQTPSLQLVPAVALNFLQVHF